MRPFRTLVAWLLFAAHTSYGAELTVYNHVSGASSPLDASVSEHFSKRYRVVDFSDKDHTWVFPKGVGEHRPPPPAYLESRCVSGQALVAYVISSDGRVTEAYAAKSTNEFLGELAVHLMSERRFFPGQLDGRSVPSLAVTNMRFTCPGVEAK